MILFGSVFEHPDSENNVWFALFTGDNRLDLQEINGIFLALYRHWSANK